MRCNPRAELVLGRAAARLRALSVSRGRVGDGGSAIDREEELAPAERQTDVLRGHVTRGVDLRFDPR